MANYYEPDFGNLPTFSTEKEDKEQDDPCPAHGEFEPCYKCGREDDEAARIDRAYDERRDG